jgi:subfamily B ATP-binding cassette protein MsbA
MVALVGESGGGKTTAMKMLNRTYDPQEGSITFDGLDLREFDRDWLRQRIAVVKQHIDIFDGSIATNVSYPNPHVSEEQIWRALAYAHIDHEIRNPEKFPQGIYTKVGDRGIKLSGGQQQRIGIARALIAIFNGADILLLDEYSSDLDALSEKEIQPIIDMLRDEHNITVVVVAHRLATIQKADMIYVIRNGEIVESGDHNRLLTKNGLYSELVKLQQIGELK